MKTILFGLFFMLFESVACAQVQAPNYTDASEWKYFDCGEMFFQPNDENYVTWHEDYRPVVMEGTGKELNLTVMYKPVDASSVEKLSEEEILRALKENPWLLFDISVSKTSNEESIQLFEYVDGSWKHIGTFKTDQEITEMRKLLREKYDLNAQ